jgi:hypothetical protein
MRPACLAGSVNRVARLLKLGSSPINVKLVCRQVAAEGDDRHQLRTLIAIDGAMQHVLDLLRRRPAIRL